MKWTSRRLSACAVSQFSGHGELFTVCWRRLILKNGIDVLTAVNFETCAKVLFSTRDHADCAAFLRRGSKPTALISAPNADEGKEGGCRARNGRWPCGERMRSIYRCFLSHEYLSALGLTWRPDPHRVWCRDLGGVFTKRLWPLQPRLIEEIIWDRHVMDHSPGAPQVEEVRSREVYITLLLTSGTWNVCPPSLCSMGAKGRSSKTPRGLTWGYCSRVDAWRRVVLLLTVSTDADPWVTNRTRSLSTVRKRGRDPEREIKKIGMQTLTLWIRILKVKGAWCRGPALTSTFETRGARIANRALITLVFRGL